ncbi:hypothetical protein LCGC14_1058770 [marine sediment metagenome]|uniref:Uncharacterized protein n=1 Tax=marine sediment metagenome TaxID=412755 RepID=A0A0F9QSL5_9ZZZZ
MSVTGIEVIRRNPGRAIGVLAGEKVKLNIGDTLKVNVSLDYRGHGQTVTLYSAIGSRLPIIGFDEYLVGQASIVLPESPTDFTHVEGSVDIEITAIASGAYDLYCKIKEDPEAGLPEVNDVIDITGEYELVQHTVYPWAYTFEGHAEVCTFEFKITPEQVPGTEWLAERIVDAFVSELEKDNSRLLEIKVSRDTSPPLWTNYLVEVTATASPLLWTLIIAGVLAIVFIFAINFAIRTIDDVFFKPKGLSDETLKELSRETLLSMILDLEPETPPQILEEKSDQELRDLLNQILAERAPSISWWPLAIAGGLAVLGVGAAVLVVGRRA